MYTYDFYGEHLFQTDPNEISKNYEFDRHIIYTFKCLMVRPSFSQSNAMVSFRILIKCLPLTELCQWQISGRVCE